MHSLCPHRASFEASDDEAVQASLTRFVDAETCWEFFKRGSSNLGMSKGMCKLLGGASLSFKGALSFCGYVRELHA